MALWLVQASDGFVREGERLVGYKGNSWFGYKGNNLIECKAIYVLGRSLQLLAIWAKGILLMHSKPSGSALLGGTLSC